MSKAMSCTFTILAILSLQPTQTHCLSFFKWFLIQLDHISFVPRPCGGARKPENEATAVKVAEFAVSFPGHVGGARKWDGKEVRAMNWQSRLLSCGTF